MTLSEAERIEAFNALSDLMDALTVGFTVVGRIATLLAETPQPPQPETGEPVHLH
jgi:hypothetical protein